MHLKIFYIYQRFLGVTKLGTYRGYTRYRIIQLFQERLSETKRQKYIQQILKRKPAYPVINEF